MRAEEEEEEGREGGREGGGGGGGWTPSFLLRRGELLHPSDLVEQL